MYSWEDEIHPAITCPPLCPLKKNWENTYITLIIFIFHTEVFHSSWAALNKTYSGRTHEFILIQEYQQLYITHIIF